MKFKTLSILIFVLFLSGFYGCENNRNVKPKEEISVRLKWRHQSQFAGLYMAEKQGYYDKENIKVSLEEREPNLSNLQIAKDLAGGETHFAIMGGDVVLSLISEGYSLVCIGVIFQRNPYTYATLKSSNIHRPQDLVGKKIMLPLDAIAQHEALMVKMGIALSDIEYAAYDRDADFLANGKIDAQLVYRTGSGIRLEEKGLDLNFIWMDDFGMKFYADSIVTTEKMIKDNPGIVKSFLSASLKGWRYAIENTQEAVKVTMLYNPTADINHQAKAMQIQTPIIHTGDHYIGWMEHAVWENMQKTLKIPEDKLQIKEAYTMDFLHEIFGK